MKKAVKALVGLALALTFAVAPAALGSGDSASSVNTVSASGYVVVRQSKPFWWNGRYCIYAVYYQGRFVGGSDTGLIG